MLEAQDPQSALWGPKQFTNSSIRAPSNNPEGNDKAFAQQQKIRLTLMLGLRMVTAVSAYSQCH